jgi:acyl carrier protein
MIEMSGDSETVDGLRQVLREYLTQQFGANAAGLDDDTPLFSSGLIDSLSVIDFVTFIESKTGQTIPPIDITLDNLDTIGRILNLLQKSAANEAD